MKGIVGTQKRRAERLLAFALSVCFCIAFWPGITVRAGDGGLAELAGETVETVAGAEGVQMDISIVGCPVFYGIVLDIEYDYSALTLTGIVQGPAVAPSDANFMGNIRVVDGDYGRVTFDGNRVFPGGYFYTTASDGILFTLIFDVKDTAPTGTYPIKITRKDFIDPYFQDLDMIIGAENDGLVGAVKVNPPSLARVGLSEYGKLSDALHAAVAISPATVTLLGDVTIDCLDERIVIPDGADLVLDMNGKTVTADYDYSQDNLRTQFLVEIQEGAKLEIVSLADDRGRFDCPDRQTTSTGLRFLLNSGELDMSDIDVADFYQGIRDDKSVYAFDPSYDSTTPLGATDAVFGTIENCSITTEIAAMSFASSTVASLRNCQLFAERAAFLVGAMTEAESGAEVGLIDSCVIESTVRPSGWTGPDRSQLVMIGAHSTLGTIRDSLFRNTATTGDAHNDIGIIENRGTIGKITSSSALNHTHFQSPSSLLDNYGTIGLIESDFTFFDSSEGYALSNLAGQIDDIQGGVFRGASHAGLDNQGAIGSISGGLFIGDSHALVNDGAGASIDQLAGGYYKTATGEEQILDTGTIIKPLGYDLSTVALRPLDLPLDFPGFLVDEGFHHFGPVVEVAWKVEGRADKTDCFVTGDPVYFPHGPLEAGGYFRGWNDGETLFEPEAELPPASVPVTYTAEVFAIGDAQDYRVVPGLAEGQSNQVNAGEQFEVELAITSEGNQLFSGASFEIAYDASRVNYTGGTLAESFGLTDKGAGKLEIAGASADGFFMPTGVFDLAILSFEAKADLATGQTVIAVESPLVARFDGDDALEIGQADPLTVNLWNLHVSFRAGANVSMEETIACVRYGEAGLYTDTRYQSLFSEPAPRADEHYLLDTPPWKPSEGAHKDFDAISDSSFTADAVFTATASPLRFTFTDVSGCLEQIGGLDKGEAVYGLDVTFKVRLAAGYVVKEVCWRVGDGQAQILEADTGIYTINGNDIRDDVTVWVDFRLAGEMVFTDGEQFNSLPDGYQLLSLVVETRPDEGWTYKYDGSPMFYSSAYSRPGAHVYLYIVANGITADGAGELLELAAGRSVELAYDGNVNGDGRLNSTDVVLIYGLYNGLHLADPDFGRVSMKMRLEADANGDGVVDTQDALAVLRKIWRID